MTSEAAPESFLRNPYREGETSQPCPQIAEMLRNRHFRHITCWTTHHMTVRRTHGQQPFCLPLIVKLTIHLILRVCGSHICLLQIWSHCLVEGELFQEVLEGVGLPTPLRRSIGWDRSVGQLVGEFFASRGIRIHIDLVSVESC